MHGGMSGAEAAATLVIFVAVRTERGEEGHERAVPGEILSWANFFQVQAIREISWARPIVFAL